VGAGASILKGRGAPPNIFGQTIDVMSRAQSTASPTQIGRGFAIPIAIFLEGQLFDRRKEKGLNHERGKTPGRGEFTEL